MSETRVDRWLQRLSVAAMVAFAVALVALGVTLYASPVTPAGVNVEGTGVANR